MVIIKINKIKEDVRRSWIQWKTDNWELYKSLMQICVLCGSDNSLQIHHKNFNKSDNEFKNLICLCEDCHIGLHGRSRDAIQYKNRAPELIEYYKNPKKIDLNDIEWRSDGWYNKKLGIYLT